MKGKALNQNTKPIELKFIKKKITIKLPEETEVEEIFEAIEQRNLKRKEKKKRMKEFLYLKTEERVERERGEGTV